MEDLKDFITLSDNSEISNDESTEQISKICFKDEDTTFNTNDSEDLNQQIYIDYIENEGHHQNVGDFFSMIDSLTDERYQAKFRLPRESVNSLITKYEDEKINHMDASFDEDNVLLSARNQIHVTLDYIGNIYALREVAQFYGITLYSAYKAITNVTSWLVEIAPEYVHFPKSVQEQSDNAKGFKKLCSIEGVIGVLHACHIQISRPNDDWMEYVNKKGTYSIYLQGVIDDKSKFIDICCGELGGVDKQIVLERSEVYKLSQSENLINEKYHLIGDYSYNCKNWLLTPYIYYDTITDLEHEFNLKMAQANCIAKNAFDLLRGKWLRLYYFENFKIEFIIDCILSACILHNIYIDWNHGKNTISSITACEPCLENSDELKRYQILLQTMKEK